ncbi:MAG: hypothetical protein IKQ35_00400 [Bacilli bacterium]|nr:hypothetical protein [Bacilli bacterium]
MKGLFKRFDKKILFRLLILSCFVIVTMLSIRNFKFTESKYETLTDVEVKPTIAFFIADVKSYNDSIKLEEIVPRSDPYLYSFTVSNFKGDEKANVDLTYSIEFITTTNMPLNYKLYKGNDLTHDITSSTSFSTDDDGMYYKHLYVSGVSTLKFNAKNTDTYVLSVEFPEIYKNNPQDYSGVVELIEIYVHAEQEV